MVDRDYTRGKVEGILYVHSAVDTTTIQSYNVYWGSSSTMKMNLITNMEVSSEIIISFDLSTDIPSGATHLLVYTLNGAGEMTTGISTRVLDHVQNNLYSIPAEISSMEAWLESDVNALVCRVSVPYAALNLAYSNINHDIDGQGNRVISKPPINTGVQYPYYAKDDYLLDLPSQLNFNVQFNQQKYISCKKAS